MLLLFMSSNYQDLFETCNVDHVANYILDVIHTPCFHLAKMYTKYVRANIDQETLFKDSTFHFRIFSIFLIEVLLLIKNVGLLLPVQFDDTSGNNNEEFKKLIKDMYNTEYITTRANATSCYFCVNDVDNIPAIEPTKKKGKTNIALFMSILMRLIDTNKVEFDQDGKLGDNLQKNGFCKKGIG